MKDTVSKEAAAVYKEFDRKRQRTIRRVSISFLIILTCVLISLTFVTSSYIPLVISAVSLFAYGVAARIRCRKLDSTHKSLYAAAYGEQTESVRTGIFKDIWEEYQDNRFERLLEIESLEIEFEVAYDNTIEVEAKRHHHKWFVLVDEQNLHCSVDRETEEAMEQTTPLQNLGGIDGFYEAVAGFISTYS